MIIDNDVTRSCPWGQSGCDNDKIVWCGTAAVNFYRLCEGKSSVCGRPIKE